MVRRKWSEIKASASPETVELARRDTAAMLAELMRDRLHRGSEANRTTSGHPSPASSS